MKVKLGRQYRDVITGAEGVATSVTEYLNGCRRVALERLKDDKSEIVILVFDEPNLEELKAEPVVTPKRGPRTGGPHDHGSVVDTH